jgi:hypothetical protein
LYPQTFRSVRKRRTRSRDTPSQIDAYRRKTATTEIHLELRQPRVDITRYTTQMPPSCPAFAANPFAPSGLSPAVSRGSRKLATGSPGFSRKFDEPAVNRKVDGTLNDMTRPTGHLVI